MLSGGVANHDKFSGELGRTDFALHVLALRFLAEFVGGASPVRHVLLH